MSLRSANVEFGTAAGAAMIGLLLVLLADYGTTYRLLGLLIPLGLLSLYMSTRSLKQQDLQNHQHVLEAVTEPARPG